MCTRTQGTGAAVELAHLATHPAVTGTHHIGVQSRRLS